jgi:hypothetical protein
MRDADVRKALRRALEEEHAGDIHTRVVEEMNVWSGSARVDFAVINGRISGYEIKSDRDTLSRLPLQRDIYGKVFDNIVLVVGPKHAKNALEIVPAWWGITLASFREDDIFLQPDRPPQQNASQDPMIIVELLSKAEAIELLERYDLATGWRSKRIGHIYRHLVDALPLDALKAGVRDILKKRPNWLGQNRTHQLDVAIHADRDPVL